MTATQVPPGRYPADRGRALAPGRPGILVIFDAGYDVTRLSCLLADLPVELLGGCAQTGCCTSARRRGGPERMAGPAGTAANSPSLTLPPGRSRRYDHNPDHPVRDRRGAGLGPAAPAAHPPLGLAGPPRRPARHRRDTDPLAGRLPAWQPGPKPVWLWSSRTGAARGEVDQLWQAFLRALTWKHTFRLFKQVPGWTAPKVRDPAAGRWTWLVIAAHAQLRLARPLAAALRRPWGTPSPPRAADPLPAPAAGSGTSTRRLPSRPAHRNPAGPAPGGRPGPGTAVPHPPRRRQDYQTTTHAQGQPRTRRLNGKLRSTGGEPGPAYARRKLAAIRAAAESCGSPVGRHVWCQSLLLPTVELTARSHRGCRACASSYDSAGRRTW
jgi:hypothetical protein